MLISLVGLPGAGKSTVGRRLAAHLGLAFADCDTLLEQRLQRPIREVFESEGEQRFRDAESELLMELAMGADTVIATGGGAVLRPANRELLRARTFCIYLNAEPGALERRLRSDRKRPLLQVADPAQRLRDLHDERTPHYREVATLEIDTRGQTPRTLVEAIVARLPSFTAHAGDIPVGPA